MKRLTALMAVVCAAWVVFAGCGSRSLPEELTESSSPSSQTSSVSSSAEESELPESSAASSQPQEEKPPAPDLTEVDLEIVTQDLHTFLAYFSDVKEARNASELDQQTVLDYLLAQINQQQAMQGYFFTSDDDGNLLISADLVAENAQRLLGLSSFKMEEADSYDEETDCYVYTPADPAGLPDGITISDPMGGDENVLSFDVTFAGGTTSRYHFKLLRVNGMPYLQFSSIETL